jgi:hypothetical protein
MLRNIIDLATLMFCVEDPSYKFIEESYGVLYLISTTSIILDVHEY